MQSLRILSPLSSPIVNGRKFKDKQTCVSLSTTQILTSMVELTWTCWKWERKKGPRTPCVDLCQCLIHLQSRAALGIWVPWGNTTLCLLLQITKCRCNRLWVLRGMEVHLANSQMQLVGLTRQIWIWPGFHSTQETKEIRCLVLRSRKWPNPYRVLGAKKVATKTSHQILDWPTFWAPWENQCKIRFLEVAYPWVKRPVWRSMSFQSKI